MLTIELVYKPANSGQKYTYTHALQPCNPSCKTHSTTTPTTHPHTQQHTLCRRTTLCANNNHNTFSYASVITYTVGRPIIARLKIHKRREIKNKPKNNSATPRRHTGPTLNAQNRSRHCTTHYDGHADRRHATS